MPLLFIPLWGAVSVFLAFMGGWRKLAMTYRANHPFFGKKFYFQSASMRRMTNYNKVLIIGANREGLFISVLFIFRLGHPPLFIPWAEISIKAKEEKFFDRCELTPARCPDIPITISQGLMEKISTGREESAPITP
jgi:hypothetical protein